MRNHHAHDIMINPAPHPPSSVTHTSAAVRPAGKASESPARTVTSGLSNSFLLMVGAAAREGRGLAVSL
jgi:hypothetical protein